VADGIAMQHAILQHTEICIFIGMVALASEAQSGLQTSDLLGIDRAR
jgi:hypothetical protein